MPGSSPSSAQPPGEITSLLTEIVEVLTEEQNLLSGRNWNDLPYFKRKKVILASRLKKLVSVSSSTSQTPRERLFLESQIALLEAESRRKIESQIELISNQLAALQNLHLYWRECLSVSFSRESQLASAS